MVFKSKIAWWFYGLEVLLGSITIVMVYLAVTHRQIVLYVAALVFLLIMGLMMLPMLLNTKYVLEETQLRVACGLYAKRIPYADILGVEPDNFDPSSSPALSLDRLQIRYRSKDSNCNYLSLSPRHKEQFIKELARRTAGSN